MGTSLLVSAGAVSCYAAPMCRDLMSLRKIRNEHFLSVRGSAKHFGTFRASLAVKNVAVTARGPKI